jgi:hypothetical protein
MPMLPDSSRSRGNDEVEVCRSTFSGTSGAVAHQVEVRRNLPSWATRGETKDHYKNLAPCTCWNRNAIRLKASFRSSLWRVMSPAQVFWKLLPRHRFWRVATDKCRRRQANHIDSWRPLLVWTPPHAAPPNIPVNKVHATPADVPVTESSAVSHLVSACQVIDSSWTAPSTTVVRYPRATHQALVELNNLLPRIAPERRVLDLDVIAARLRKRARQAVTRQWRSYQPRRSSLPCACST